jgi:hypothetical protein
MHLRPSTSIHAHVPPRYMSNPLDVPGDSSVPAKLLTWQICSSSILSVHPRGQYLGSVTQAPVIHAHARQSEATSILGAFLRGLYAGTFLSSVWQIGIQYSYSNSVAPLLVEVAVAADFRYAQD